MLTILLRTALLLWVFAWTACGNSPTAPSPPSSDFAAQFDSLWTTFDREYSYFEHKRVDWPATRATYRPRALAAANQAAFMEVIREMLGTLHDGHVTLRDPSGRQTPTYTSQGFVNWDRAVFDQYRGRAGWTQGQIDWGHGVLDGVPYIAIGGWGNQAIRTADFDAAFERYRDAPALILDVRMNSGGNDQLAFEIAGRFTRSTVRAGYVKFRNGPAHTNFGPPNERTVSPRGPWQFAGNVLLLIGRRCASSNESFIVAMAQMPNVVLVGDRTAGSTGNPGTFPLAGGWSYTPCRDGLNTRRTTG
jgi:carboxyl-terminal processing protease